MSPIYISRAHIYKKYKQYPTWLVDICMTYCDEHRNTAYMGLLLRFSDYLLREVE